MSMYTITAYPQEMQLNAICDPKPTTQAMLLFFDIHDFRKLFFTY
jgi:hypothetical protein